MVNTYINCPGSTIDIQFFRKINKRPFGLNVSTIFIHSKIVLSLLTHEFITFFNLIVYWDFHEHTAFSTSCGACLQSCSSLEMS